MSQFNQQSTARRFTAFHTCCPPYSEGYECELPEQARRELLPPKRPHILHRPLSAPHGRGCFLKWVGAFGLSAIILVSVIANYSRQHSAPAAPAPDLVLEHSKALLAQQQAQQSGSDGTAYGKAGVIGRREAPRAVLVQASAPRAELIGHLPPGRTDKLWPMLMPYGIEVLATYKGRLASEKMLPPSGNALGDIWVVGDTPWVWLFAPGAAHADWIDP
jgi:hypothetical protein